MSRYRIHIDIPLGADQEEALSKINSVMGHCISEEADFFRSMGIDKIGIRLGHDDDRQKSNYLNINDNGHVSNKKTVIDI